MGLLDDRVAIVTGSGRGIGAAVAKRLAAEGAAIIVNDLGGAVDGTGSDNEPADEVVQAIRDAGGTAVANYNDVSNYDAAENIIQSALKEYGKLDVLVNVAGILRDRMIFNMNEDEWDAVIRVHLKGTFNTSKFASIYWRQERQGHYRSHQLHLGLRPARRARPAQLRRRQNGHRGADLLLRQRPQPLRRHGQRHKPLRVDADDRDGPGRPEARKCQQRGSGALAG